MSVFTKTQTAAAYGHQLTQRDRQTDRQTVKAGSLHRIVEVG